MSPQHHWDVPRLSRICASTCGGGDRDLVQLRCCSLPLSTVLLNADDFFPEPLTSGKAQVARARYTLTTNRSVSVLAEDADTLQPRQPHKHIYFPTVSEHVATREIASSDRCKDTHKFGPSICTLSCFPLPAHEHYHPNSVA